MKLVLLTLIVFGLALLGMSVGVIFGNRCIRGTCGGLSNAYGKQGGVTCEACCSCGQNRTSSGSKQVPTDR
jgi:hypothetical protein